LCILLVKATVTDLKQDNGGILTRDMDTADVRIADHVRTRGRSAPENSVSYKFIEQSVKKGALEDIDNHRITGIVRNPAASTRPSHGKKTPFTGSDDQILSNWVAKKEQEHAALTGNKIFQELEAVCPHHSWQSWRSRYVSYKNLLPKPKLSAPEPAVRVAASHKHAPAPPRNQRAAPAPASSRPQPAGTGRVKFTEDDDQLLLQYVHEAREVGKPTSGNKIYQELAEEYPHHSWHSWRDRYVRILEPRLRPAALKDAASPASEARQFVTEKAVTRKPSAKSAGGRPAAVAPVTQPARPVAKSTGVDDDDDFPSIDELLATEDSQVRQAKRHPGLRNNGNSDRVGVLGPSSTARGTAGLSIEDLDRRLAEIELAKLLQPHVRGYFIRSALRQLKHYLPQLQAATRGVFLRSKLRDFEEDLVRLQAHASGALVRMALRPEEEDDSTDGAVAGLEERNGPAGDLTPRPPRSPKTPKEEFYSLLNGYLDATGAQIDLWPKIQGRALDLWELWQAVKSLDQGRSPSIRNWEQIAENLGFDWIDEPEVTVKLKNCYEANLGEFEELQEAFEAEDLGSQAEWESQRSAADEDTVLGVAHPVLPSGSLPFQSSPPRITGQKRPFQPELVPSSVFSPVKRMRYSKDMVIPSSPEQKKAAATPRLSAKDVVLYDRGRATAVSSVRLDGLSHPSPERLPPSKATLGPETQDLGFENGFHSQPDIVSVVDTSPSEHLQFENSQLSPIPFSGFKLRDVPYRSPLGQASSNPSQGKIVPDPAVAKHINGGSIVPLIEDPDDHLSATKLHRTAEPRSSSPVEAKAKRRSLPASFRRAVSPPGTGPKAAPPAPPRVSLPTVTNNHAADLFPPLHPSRDRPSHDTATIKTKQPSLPTRPTHSPGSLTPASPPPPKILPSGPTPPEGCPMDEVMDFYMSLGYRQSHIIEAFKATLTWGLAAVVMQELKEGRGIPANWEGVWTAGDDRDLRFVLEVEGEVQARRRSGEPPGREDRARARRAERARRRLETKHGRQRMEDRKISFKVYVRG